MSSSWSFKGKQGNDYASGRILSYIFSLAGLVILVRLAGFVEKQFLAYYFGSDVDLDAFIVAQSVPMMVFFMMTAVITPTILPMFVRRSQQNDRTGAWSQINAWGVVLLATLSLGVVLPLAFVDPITRLLAPGFDPKTREICGTMLRFMIPLSVIMSLIPLTRSVLDAERKFLIPPLAELLMKAASIGALILFVKNMGVQSLVLGAVIGVLAALSFHGSALARSWVTHRVAPNFSDPDFRFVLFLMLAPGLGTALSQIGSIIENAACSTLATGSVSALAYARKIVNLPLLVIPAASGTVLFTFFAELTHRKEHESTAALLVAGMRTMLFIFVPISVLTCILAEPIVAVVYQRGRFDAESTKLVATILLWLSPSMCLYAVEMMIMRHFFAREDLWTPIMIGMTCVLLKVAIIWMGVGRIGVVAVAGAIVVSRALKVLLLLYFACVRAGISLKQLDLHEARKLIPSALLSGAVAFLLFQQFGPFLSSSLLERCILLALVGGASAMVYFTTALALGSRECRYVMQKLKWRMF